MLRSGIHWDYNHYHSTSGYVLGVIAVEYNCSIARSKLCNTDCAIAIYELPTVPLSRILLLTLLSIFCQVFDGCLLVFLKAVNVMSNKQGYVFASVIKFTQCYSMLSFGLVVKIFTLNLCSQNSLC
jgi:hypothetical protein